MLWGDALCALGGLPDIADDFLGRRALLLTAAAMEAITPSMSRSRADTSAMAVEAEPVEAWMRAV